MNALTPRFKATQKDGKLIVENGKMFSMYLRSLGDKILHVIVEVRRKNRSSNQNRYYWGVVLAVLAIETEHSPEELHEVLKGMFLQEHILLKGKEVTTVRSTADLNTADFEIYLTRCRHWSQEFLSITIPLPNEDV